MENFDLDNIAIQSILCAIKVFTSLQKVSLAVSTYHFLGVSLDRFFAIKMPMAYRQILS